MTEEYTSVRDRTIDHLLAADPVAATSLGDHRFDSLLPDLSTDQVRDRIRQFEDDLTAVDAVDDEELSRDDAVDLEMLRTEVARRIFELREVARHTWDPMVWNPGTALYQLLHRDFAPQPDRLASVRDRLRLVPDVLATARHELGDMSGIHVETAIAQLNGTSTLITEQVQPLLDGAPEAVEAVVALQEFRDWLETELPRARRTPRLGERTYAGALWYALDDHTSAVRMLEAAEAHLDEVTAQLRETATRFLGESGSPQQVVRRALAAVADRAPTTAGTIRGIVEEAVRDTRAFLQRADLVTIPDIQVSVMDMPSIHRGVAVAYCDAPGPLEVQSLPTFIAVAPPPDSWSREQQDSFYREYNAMQLHDLTIHEGFPGHVLQLATAGSITAPVRRLAHSGTFIEGWAVFAEEIMIDRGYDPGGMEQSALALRLQQLKMQARMAINAILDVRVHTMEMTQDEALSLMMHRGFQEVGEALGKWRRAQLTAAQLPTYFVGYRAIREIAQDLRVLHADWSDRQIHDLMLGQGSIAPRHVRALLGI